MRPKHRKTKLLLVTLVIVAALTALALIKIVSEIILPTIFPPPPPPRLPPPPALEVPQNPLSLVFSVLYNSSPYLAPLAWIAFLLRLFWKGKIRAFWQRRGYDYDTFKVITRMRGSPVRINILQNLSVPKSRLQLSKELGMDWKSINNHVDILINYNLVKEVVSIGTAKYLIITERGKETLELLKHGESDSRPE